MAFPVYSPFYRNQFTWPLRIRIDRKGVSMWAEVFSQCAVLAVCGLATLPFIWVYMRTTRSPGHAVFLVVWFVLCFGWFAVCLVEAIAGVFFARNELVIDSAHLCVRNHVGFFKGSARFSLAHLSNLRFVPDFLWSAALLLTSRGAVRGEAPGQLPPTWRRCGVLLADEEVKTICLAIEISPDVGEGILRAILDWSARQGVCWAQSERG